MENTMTMKEFYLAIADLDTAPTDELKEYAKAQAEKIVARNKARASKPSKTALANEPVKVEILKALGEKPNMLASEIALALDISTQKASALAKQLVTEGKVVSSDVKIKGKGTKKSYALADECEDEPNE